MNKVQLIDLITSKLMNKCGKLESIKSWIAMRNYLEQLDEEQLKLLLTET